MTFPPGMMEVIKKRHAYPSALRDMVIHSRQFKGKEAFEAKFIDGVISEDKIV